MLDFTKDWELRYLKTGDGYHEDIEYVPAIVIGPAAPVTLNIGFGMRTYDAYPVMTRRPDHAFIPQAEKYLWFFKWVRTKDCLTGPEVVTIYRQEHDRLRRSHDQRMRRIDKLIERYS